MGFETMRTRATLVLSAVAAAQIALLGASLAFLAPKFLETRSDLLRRGQEELAFLNQLANAESDIYRASALLRDNIILSGPQQALAHEELLDVLTRMADHSVQAPTWISSDMRVQLEVLESSRREYMARARVVSEWPEQSLKTLGPEYLSRELTPTRESFVSGSRKIADLARFISAEHYASSADSIGRIGRLTLRLVAGAAILGLALAAVAIRRFREFEKERDAHLEHLQQAENDLRALSQRLVTSQEQERKRLSRDLHDEVGQLLTALRVQLGQVEPSTGSGAHLSQASELADRSLRSVRDMARGLRPAMLDDLGLAPAINWLGRDFSKNTILDVDVQIEGSLADLDESTRTCVFRLVQEALTNCVKHSGAARARVLLHESPHELVVTIQDSGSGFTPGHARGIGILGMRERVEELGGEFAVISSAGTGTLVRAHLPKTTIVKT